MDYGSANQSGSYQDRVSWPHHAALPTGIGWHMCRAKKAAGKYWCVHFRVRNPMAGANGRFRMAMAVLQCGRETGTNCSFKGGKSWSSTTKRTATFSFP